MSQVELGLSQVCGRDPAVGVASVPGVPMSVAWCHACLRAEVVPVWVCQFWRDMCDGRRDELAPWAHSLIDSTLAYFGIVVDSDELDAWWAAWQPIGAPDD